MDLSDNKKSMRYILSARKYFIVLYLALFFLLFPAISYYFIYKTNSFRDAQLDQVVTARNKSLEDKATYLTRLISHNGSQSISEYNFSFLNNVIQETVSSDDDRIGCRILKKSLVSDDAGLGTEDPGLQRRIIDGRNKQPRLLKFPQELDSTHPLPVIKVAMDSSDKVQPATLLFIAPIYVGNSFWGTVNAVFSLENLNQDTQRIADDWIGQMRQYKISLSTLALIFLVFGTIFAYLFTRPMVKSLLFLQGGVDLVARGNLDHRIDVRKVRIKEMANLTRQFNTMTENLQQSRKQLDNYSHSLEDKVEERTRELKETQKELLHQAHEAGMAEMAVGVLHNIGNAITPAKVHGVLLEKKLAASPLRNNLAETISQAATIIRNAVEVPQAEREQLATIVSLIPESIKEEYDESLDAVRNIVTKHSYIEAIINLQMRYAKVHEIDELVEVNRVVLDGLKIMEDTINKHFVKVTTDLHDVPSVRIDEAKLLQILANLIKNSCEAMDSSEAGRRQLSITTTLEEENGKLVRLSVKDTGRGFTPKEQESLFSFGYSTKKRCSGYGLHSCANYLIANNGSIKAFSEGVGQGAEFIIRLQTEV